MSTLYKILTKGRKIIAENQTVDQIVDFKIKNIQNAADYIIEEMTPRRNKNEAGKQTEEDLELKYTEKRRRFLSSLTETQKLEIESGDKKIVYNDQTGNFYVKVVEKETSFFSHNLVKDQNIISLKNNIKKSILNLSVEICKNSLKEDLTMFDEDDVLEILKEIKL